MPGCGRQLAAAADTRLEAAERGRTEWPPWTLPLWAQYPQGEAGGPSLHDAQAPIPRSWQLGGGSCRRSDRWAKGWPDPSPKGTW